MNKRAVIVVSLTTFVVTVFLFIGIKKPQALITSTNVPYTNIINAQDVKNSFSIIEVSKHNSAADCYLIIKNNVYNVSEYINKHPGGVHSIMSHCGKEVTGIFASIHSNFAWNLLKNYEVGKIAKIIDNNALYEIHTDQSGKVVSKETQNNEFDWNNWGDDK